MKARRYVRRVEKQIEFLKEHVSGRLYDEFVRDV